MGVSYFICIYVPIYMTDRSAHRATQRRPSHRRLPDVTLELLLERITAC